MNYDTWHYTDGENSIGPLTEERLRAFHAGTVVTDDTLVCRSGGTEWIRFADAFELTEGITGDQSSPGCPRSKTTRRRGLGLLTTAITLVVAGIICLVLPLNRAPVAVWLATPVFFGAAIIFGHLVAARNHAYFLGLDGKKTGYLCAGLVYLLFGICSCAVLLITLILRDAQPVYLRSGWHGIDVFQPATFSWALLRADVAVNAPSDPSLQQVERRAAEELAHLITAKNKLWLMTRMKIEHANSAHQFARVIGQAAVDFKALGRRLEAVPQQFGVEGFEANQRLAVIMVRLTQESNAKTAAETQVCNATLAADVQRFGSDSEVQQAMPQLLAALNPSGMLSDLTAAVRNLGTAFSDPSNTDRIEAARTSVETAISNLDRSIELNPDLHALLDKALDRSVDLKPSQRRENGPWGTYYTVIGDQSVAAKAVAAATDNAVNLLTSYPTFLLIQPRSDRSPSTTNAPAYTPSAEGAYLDRASLRKYFGAGGFLPRLGDDLEEVARRASTKIVHRADHNYVTAASPKALLDGSCTFTAVGSDRIVEGIVVYAPQIIDDQEHDLTPLADQIRAALSPTVFRHAASTNLLEVWASTDETLVVCVRKFPRFETGGHTYHGSSNVVFGNAVGARLITDKQYFTRAPNPFAEDPVASADNEANPISKATGGEKSVDPQSGPAEVRPKPTPAHRLAKEGTFFLLRYVSVKTPRGIYGFEPGHEVHVVRTVVGKPTLVVSDGQCELEVEPSLLTNDIDVAVALGRADATAQEQIAAQADEVKAAAAVKQHQLDLDHARDIKKIEQLRLQSSRMHATPNPLDH